MSNNVEAIEEIGKKKSSGEITDSARDAIMQAAMNKAGGAAEAQQAQQVQETSQQQDDKNVGLSAGVKIEAPESKERMQATEKLLTGSVDQLAINNLQMLGINLNKNEESKNAATEAMMQVAMDKSNPVTNTEADKDMANVAQGTTGIADTAKKDEANIQTQQVYETGDSAKMTEAKESGLSMGVKIEKPDGLEKQPQTEKLLAGSMEQMAANNMNDLNMTTNSTSES